MGTCQQGLIWRNSLTVDGLAGGAMSANKRVMTVATGKCPGWTHETSLQASVDRQESWERPADRGHPNQTETPSQRQDSPLLSRSNSQ